jgi:uncharacterized SAM-binding protein YcdF (DUF218 family)
MIRLLFILPMLIIVSIIGISVYLQPNDLAQCNGVVTDNEPCRSTDAIVVVSGGDTNARTDMAIRLYKNGWARLVIFSGAAEDKSGPSNAAAMRTRALGNGVPAAAIYLDEYSETTKQNAENTTSIFKRLGVHSVILVTSGYHQRRADLEFEKRAGEVTIYNNPVMNDEDWSMWWWTNPQGWSLATSELFKIALLKVGVGQ